MRKLLLLIAIVVLPVFAFGQATTAYQYAAKYTCGKASGSPDNFAPGIYYTSINIHSDVDVRFFKRFTVSQIDERPGGITPWIATGLPAARSLQIECRNILAHLTAAGVPIPLAQVTEGYVIIQSPTLLDVFGIYTAGNPDWVATLHMEHINPRSIPGPIPTPIPVPVPTDPTN